MARGVTTVTSESRRLAAGTCLGGRYTVTGIVRDDGGSILYAGRAGLYCGDPVMIRAVAPDDFVSPENRVNAQARFARETQMLQGLRHPALPAVLDAFTEHARHYLVLSFSPGETLEALLARRGEPFAEEDVVGWALEILSALGVMHRHDPPIIYRNVKPGNVVVDPSGMIRLLDFGLARFCTRGKRHDTAPLGVMGYAPPEQTHGTTDERSDLYALGVTMHQLLTNLHPLQHRPGLLPPASVNPTVSADLAEIIARAADPEPGRRWPSAGEMELALRRYVLALTGTGRMRMPPGPPRDAHAPATTGARLVVSAARLAAGHDEVVHHLSRLTWLPPDDLRAALSAPPVVLPLVEPYRASLRILKGLGVEARAIWPLRGMSALDAQASARLQRDGYVEVYNPAACDGGVCLCRHCHFGWILDAGSAPPWACPSCGQSGWDTATLLRCRRCDHEYEEYIPSGACPCCGLR